MTNVTTAATCGNTAVSTIDEKTVEIFEKLMKRASQTEVIMAQFSVPDAYVTIPREVINTYLTEAAVTDCSKSDRKVAPVFTGESFPSEKLKPLTDIRREVTAYMKEKGALIGKSGTYAVPVDDHDEIMSFLQDAQARYNGYLNTTLLGNYDDIVSDHRAHLAQEIEDQAVRDALIDKILTRNDLTEKAVSFFTCFGSKLPSREDLAKYSGQIYAMEAAAREQDRAFLGKITATFAEFISNFDREKGGSGDQRLGRKLSAFEKAVQVCLGFEQTITTVLCGSEFERIADSAFALLHDLKNRICGQNLTQRQKKALKDVLLSKLRLAGYVLSSERTLTDYADGKIRVLEENFSLQGLLNAPLPKEESQTEETGSAVVSAAEKALPEEQEQEFSDAFAKEHPAQEQSSAQAVSVTADVSPLSQDIPAMAFTTGAVTSLDELSIDVPVPADTAAPAELKSLQTKVPGEQEMTAPQTAPCTIDDAIAAFRSLIPSGNRTSRVTEGDRGDISSLF